MTTYVDFIQSFVLDDKFNNLNNNKPTGASISISEIKLS